MENQKSARYEGARLIDALLSTRKVVSTQDIYDMLEEKYHLLSNVYAEKGLIPAVRDMKIYDCRKKYSKIYYEGIRKLKDDIQRLGIDSEKMLIVEPCSHCRRNFYYSYAEEGFSAYKGKDNKTNGLEDKNKKKEYSEDIAEAQYIRSIKSFINLQQANGAHISCRDIEKSVEKLKEILNSAEEEIINNNFSRSIKKLSSLKKRRGKNWVIEFANLLSEIEEDFRNYSRNIAYADLLIEYANFITNYNIQECCLHEAIYNDPVEFAQKMYQEAIDMTVRNKDKARQAQYLLKYGIFLNKTFQSDLLHAVCVESIKILEELRQTSDIDLEYSYALHLYANCLYNTSNRDESKKYYKAAFDIRAHLLNIDMKALNKINLEKIDLDDLCNFTNTINNLAQLYSEEGKYEEALALHEKALCINRICARIRPQLYNSYVAWSLKCIGDIYLSKEDSGKALQHYGKAYKFYKNLIEKQPKVHEYIEDYCSCASNLSYIYICDSEYNKAKNLIKESLSQAKYLATNNQTRYTVFYATELLKSASICLLLKKFKQAKKQALRALTIFKACRHSEKTYDIHLLNRKIILTDSFLANIYNYTYKSRKALRHSAEAVELSQIEFSRICNKQEFETYTAIINQHKNILLSIKNFDGAISLMYKAFETIKDSQYATPLHLIDIKKDITLIYSIYMKEYDKAVAIHEEIIKEFGKHIKMTKTHVEFLYSIAGCYHKSCNHSKHKATLTEAIELCNIIKDKDASLIGLEGNLHLSLATAITEENREEAYIHFEKAIELLEETTEPGDYYIGAYISYADALSETDAKKSLHYYNRAMKRYTDTIYVFRIIENLPKIDAIIKKIPKDTEKELVDETRMLMERCKTMTHEDFITNVQ